MNRDIQDLSRTYPPHAEKKEASNNHNRRLIVDTSQGLEKDKSSETSKFRVKRRHSCGPRIALGPPSPRMAGAAKLQTKDSCGAKRRKNISLFHTPRRAMLPWQGSKSQDTRLELNTIDETGPEATTQERHESTCQEPKSETRQPPRPNQSNIVSQTTIIWQDIHPNTNNAKALEMRKTALVTALKIRENRRRTREKEFTAKIIRRNSCINFATKNQSAQKSATDHKSFEDMSTKQSGVCGTTKPCADQNWTQRPNNIKLASITSTALRSNRLECDGLNPLSNENNIFIDFTVPCKGYGKTILPSL